MRSRGGRAPSPEGHILTARLTARNFINELNSLQNYGLLNLTNRYTLPLSLFTNLSNPMSLELLYNGANLFVLPFWVLMVFLPKWGLTRAVMTSFLPFVTLAALYVYLFVTGITPDSAEAFSSASLADIARLFADEHVAATGWVHFLVMDLFVGRWIYWDGQQNQVFTVHSLLLALFAGPMGLLSHILTRWVTQRVAKTAAGAAEKTSTSDAAEPSAS